MSTTPKPDAPHPGHSLGLPESGVGSLAPWLRRVAALIVDWAASMAVAVMVFSPAVLTGHDWRRWMILALFFVSKSVLTILTGSSFGQLLAKIGVTRTDGEPLGWWRPIVRTALICLVLPALVVGAERRAIPDLLLGTAVVMRR